MSGAVTVLSKQLCGGIYLVELLGEKTPYSLLPVLLTMVIAFSTGTSCDTYAIMFPLAKPSP
jgi:Na+/H+ antiporter NhaC